MDSLKRLNSSKFCQDPNKKGVLYSCVNLFFSYSGHKICAKEGQIFGHKGIRIYRQMNCHIGRQTAYIDSEIIKYLRHPNLLNR